MKPTFLKFIPSFVIITILCFFSNTSAAEFRLAIDQPLGHQSNFVEIGVRNLTDANDSSLANGKSVGSFSFLISYGPECLRLVKVRKGSMLVEQGWESFSYQVQVNGTQGLIRITAVADTNRNDSLPPLSRTNQGEWAVLKFWVTDNCYWGCAACPVEWYWLDCQNNIIFDSTKTTAWVADTLLNWTGYPIDLKTFFPTDVSRCDTILGGDSKRFVTYANGYVLLPCGDCDERGDLNLNGLKNEVADYTVYRNYFHYGGTAFDPDPVRRQAQIAASDVNADNLTLRVSDLVFMARIILGETYPLPRTNPIESADTARLLVVQSLDHLSIWMNSTQDIRGVFLHFGFSGTAGAPIKRDSAANLELTYGISSNELRVLLSPSLDTNGSRIPAGSWPILSIPFAGSILSTESQASTYEGQELTTLVSLTQNRGDLNGDHRFSPADVVLELQCVFLGSNCPFSLADANCDGTLSTADVLEILNAVFLGNNLTCT